MTLKGSTVRSSILAIVLVVAGMVAQYQYQVVENTLLRTPFASALLPQSALSRVENREIPKNDTADFAQFWEVWKVLERDYLDSSELDPQKMVDGAIGGMTAAIGDPYTMYLPADDNKRSGEDLAGAFYGVGIELGYIENTLAAVAPLKGSPAEIAGVQAGDLIIHVKDVAKNLDEDTTGWSLSKAVENIRGPLGAPVTLTLFRQSQENPAPFEVVLERGQIIVKSVELEFVESAGKTAAHISLSRFGERTEDEWNDVVSQILAKGSDLSGIVLDMRNNPGGYFDGAITVSSDFIAKGVVVTQQGKFSKQDFPTTGAARLRNIPLVVLVNRGSASASEIVAGALRDDLGTKLVGEKTFGKGTVQDRRELPNGGGLHVTIARWLLPKGSWIHEEGLQVDIEATDDESTEQDEVLLRAIEAL
jgi:carboxyl-terminal processing protease